MIDYQRLNSKWCQTQEKMSARLSYVEFDGARALTTSYAVPLHEKLPDDFLQNYCFNVLEAAEKLAE